MSKYHDMSWSVCRPMGLISRHEKYLDGSVETPYGFVLVYSEQNYSSIQIIREGRTYARMWKRSFTPRGLAIVASRFAKNVWEAL